MSLEKKSRFVPLKISGPILSKMAQKSNILKTFNARKNLSDTLSSLLLLKQNDIQEATEMGLHNKQSRQIYITSVMNTAQVREEFMPRDKHNRKILPYNGLISKLNSIILGQYFIRNSMNISPEDVIEIQKADPFSMESEHS